MHHFKTKTFFLIVFILFLLLAWLGVALSVIPVAQAQSSTPYRQFTAQNLDASTTINARVR